MNNIIETKFKRTKRGDKFDGPKFRRHKCDVPQIIGPIFSVSKYKS